MINEVFKGMLTKFGTKCTKDGDVIAEFTITHKSTEQSQNFLDSLSSEFHNSISDCLNSTDWKNIAFDIDGVHLKLVFDDIEEMKMPVELVGVKVANKEKDGEHTFTYSLVFTKVLNSNVDSIFATTYLKRKEETEDGKMVTQVYDIKLIS